MQKIIERDKKILIKDIEKYIEIIKKEYKNLVEIPQIKDFDQIVHIKETNTISLFVRNKEFYFPLSAYQIIENLSQLPLYGTNRNHKTYNENNIIENNNTFYDYIEHLIIKGVTPLEYFQEILLHETMHFCGANGSSALMEGLNEYFTRKLALKYNLLTNGCGYPKEIKIVKQLESIFGEEVLLKILFSKTKADIIKILNKVNSKTTDFFFNLNELMEKEFYNKYYKFNFPGINGPFEKAKKYNDINYDKSYELIKDYLNS